MKLNNKGFAISTILYGILSLIIIILMLIFANMKASKDMTHDFVDGIEENLNNCINEEVLLENCYFNTAYCDFRQYNTCIGITPTSPLLSSVAKVGDYVDYDAGNWTTTATVPSNGNLYSFGGYKSGDSRNNSVSCDGSVSNDEGGWRILSIEDDGITLIHAGMSECFIFANEAKALYVLTGSNPSGINVSGLTPRNYNEYVDNKYATKAMIATKAMVEGNSTIFPRESESIFFRKDKRYVLGDTYNGHLTYIDEGILNYAPATDTVFGIKPIVILKNTVKTIGAMPNTSGEENNKTWLLENN